MAHGEWKPSLFDRYDIAASSITITVCPICHRWNSGDGKYICECVRKAQIAARRKRDGWITVRLVSRPIKRPQSLPADDLLWIED